MNYDHNIDLFEVWLVDLKYRKFSNWFDEGNRLRLGVDSPAYKHGFADWLLDKGYAIFISEGTADAFGNSGGRYTARFYQITELGWQAVGFYDL
jgi:hypothetical protein